MGNVQFPITCIDRLSLCGNSVLPYAVTLPYLMPLHCAFNKPPILSLRTLRFVFITAKSAKGAKSFKVLCSTAFLFLL